MIEPQYRTIILQRLRERDRKCAPFARVFASYDALTDKLHHMAAKQKLRQRNRSTADDAASGEEVEALRQELGEVYKKKAINDQQLIDTNNKLAVVEKELKKVTKERDDALKRMKEMEQEVERARNTAGDTLADNQLIKDELLALHAMYDALNTKYLVCDEERNQLIDRLKEMKEHEVAVINEFNEKEQERQRQRLCAAIEEAAKPNPVADAKAPSEPGSNPALKESFEMIGLDGALSSVDFGVEHFDDVIPERCALKFECDEMGEVNDCLWHPNGKMLFTAGSDKNIRLFEFANETCTKKSMFTTSNQGVTRIDLDPECKHILGSSNDRAVRIWSIADQRQRHAFTGHTDKVSAAKFHAQGRQVVSGSHDRTIKIFDIGANRCQKTLMPGSTVFDIASNDRFGIPIISGHFDKSIRFWDTRCDTHTNVVKMNGKVTSLSVSTDGQYLLCSSRDETLSLIDLRNYGIVHIYSAEQYRTSSDYSKCIISPGMKFVAAGSAEGHVFIWNLNTTKLEKVLYKGGHEGHAVLSISWHPSGHMLLTGDRRKTACIWR